MSQPFNSFGINPTIFQNMPPPIPHTVAGPSAFMGHGPALVNPMQQEKPLQLNQLPGFNLFNVSIKIQISRVRLLELKLHIGILKQNLILKFSGLFCDIVVPSSVIKCYFYFIKSPRNFKIRFF